MGELVALPALSAVSGTALSQFKIREIWDLRIRGVSGVENLQRDLLEKGCEKESILRMREQLVRIEATQFSLEHMLSSNGPDRR